MEMLLGNAQHEIVDSCCWSNICGILVQKRQDPAAGGVGCNHMMGWMMNLIKILSLGEESMNVLGVSHSVGASCPFGGTVNPPELERDGGKRGQE